MSSSITDFLCDSSATVLETHSARVVLTATHAYKWKKPVDLGFLDFSTLEKRKAALENEYRLNQRLTEGVYEGVYPVYQTPEGLSWEDDGKAEVVEYVLRMQRLEESGFLHHRLREELPFPRRDLTRLAEVLAAFYATASGGHTHAYRTYGNPEALRKTLNEALELPETVNEYPALPTIRTFLKQFPDLHEASLKSRAASGQIVDAHGDLHLDHVHFSAEGTINIYDCIEFNDRFRYIDWLNDVAFLFMDFDYHAHHAEGSYMRKQLLKQMNTTLTPEVRALLSMYQAYRAVVRAKVALIRAESTTTTDTALQKQTEAKRYLGLALRYATLGICRTWVVISGGIATGKSTFSNALAEQWQCPAFHSDVVRKELAGIGPKTPTPEARKAEVYSAAFTEKTYQALLDKAEVASEREGMSILDATFRQTGQLEKLIRRANQTHTRLVFLELTADEEVVRERLRAREGKRTSSDARLQEMQFVTYLSQEQEMKKHGRFLQLDTARPLTENIRQVMSFLA